MLKPHKISRKNPDTNIWENMTVYEYRLHAFTTPKGTFTLVGTETRGTETTDTWKNLDTGEFHEYPRRSIKKWLDLGKISPVPNSTTLTWYQNPRGRL